MNPKNKDKVKILIGEALTYNADYYLKMTDIDEKNKTFLRRFFVEAISDILEYVVPETIDIATKEAAASALKISRADENNSESISDLDDRLKSIFRKEIANENQ